MRRFYLFFFFTVNLLLSTTAFAKEVVGWAENVVIFNSVKGLIMEAKIDTGAQTTSIHSSDYKIFRKDGKDWVKFELTNHKGKTLTLEEPIVRYTKIKRHFTESQVRPVIVLGLCLGRTFHKTEVNLVDRSRFKYPLLVGRKYLEKGILVDSSATFITTPACQIH